jgi:hypothetical protein
MFAPEREWVRSMADALRPMSLDDGVYVNGMTDFDALSPLQAAYGPKKYARLVDIKTKYDPLVEPLGALGVVLIVLAVLLRTTSSVTTRTSHLARPVKAHSRRAKHGCEPASLR